MPLGLSPLRNCQIIIHSFVCTKSAACSRRPGLGGSRLTGSPRPRHNGEAVEGDVSCETCAVSTKGTSPSHGANGGRRGSASGGKGDVVAACFLFPAYQFRHPLPEGGGSAGSLTSMEIVGPVNAGESIKNLFVMGDHQQAHPGMHLPV